MGSQPLLPAEPWGKLRPAAQPASPGRMVSLQKLAAEDVQPSDDELVRQLPLQAVLSIDASPTREGKIKSWMRGHFNTRESGFCKGLWEHRQNRWIFAEVEGVEPTNNAAEQALRQAVIWWKVSFGPQAAGGSRFVERLLTVVETCRWQKRNALSWMVEAVEARFAGQTAPSLLLGLWAFTSVRPALISGREGLLRATPHAAPSFIRKKVNNGDKESTERNGSLGRSCPHKVARMGSGLG